MMKASVIKAYYIDSVGKKAESIKSETIKPGSLPAIKHDDDYIWLQLNFGVPETRTFLQSLKISEPSIGALTRAEPRSRANITNDELLLVVRGAHITGGEHESMISLRVLARKNLIITCQKKNLQSVHDVIEEIDEGNPPLSAGDFIVRLNEKLIINMSELMGNVEERAIKMEERIIDDESREYKQDLSNLRRQIIRLKHFLIPQREALKKLQLDKTSWMTASQQTRLREVSEHLLHYMQMLDSSHDLAALSQEALNQRQTDQMNKRMYLLSILAAIFIPLTFLSGLFGVNLGGIPNAEDPLAFPLFAGSLIVVGILLFFIFRRRKWL